MDLATLANGPTDVYPPPSFDGQVGRDIASGRCGVCRIDLLYGPLETGFARHIPRCHKHPLSPSEQEAASRGAFNAVLFASDVDDTVAAGLFEAWGTYEPGTPEHAAFNAGWWAAHLSGETSTGRRWRL